MPPRYAGTEDATVCEDEEQTVQESVLTIAHKTSCPTCLVPKKSTLQMINVQWSE